jgi:Ca2+-transporting ATPase
MVQGGLVTLTVVAVYAGMLSRGVPPGVASTAAFVVLVTANAALILPSRSTQTRWRGLFSGLTGVSRWVLSCTLLALLAITAIPVVAQAFGFAPLAPLHWLAAMAAGLAMLIPFQLGKRLLGARSRPMVHAAGG